MREESIQLALRDYNNGAFKSLRAAAKAYRVPASTLTDRYHGKTTLRQARETQQLLSPKQEEMLIKWVLDFESIGMAPNHTQLRSMAGLISQLSGGPSTVGKEWHLRFLARHPEIKTKPGKVIDTKRVRNLTKMAISEWYDTLWKIIQNFKITTCNIWNMDEVGTALGAAINQSVIGTSSTATALIKRPLNREWCTSIECISAEGNHIKPLLIFKAKHVQQQWFIPSETPDWFYTSSAAAFTTDEIGFRWLKEVFEPQTSQNLDDDEWRLLILDGHKSHNTDEFMQFAWLHKIIAYYLIPHASHVLQPLDVAVFSSLKTRFRALIVIDAQMDDDEPLKKAMFLKRYQNARERAITESNCKSGFKATGIVPFDPDKALNSRFVLDLDKKQRPRTPDNQEIPQFAPWRPNTTPLNHRHIAQAVAMISRTTKLDRVVRNLFAKTGKRLAQRDLELAEAKREIIALKKELKQYRSRKKKRQPVNSNQRFQTLNDIKMGENGPQPPITTATTGINAPTAPSMVVLDSPTSEDAFHSALQQLTALQDIIRQV